MAKSRKTLAIAALATASLLTLSACGGGSDGGGNAGADGVVHIQLGFENTVEEPIGQAAQRWADLLEEKSDGSMQIELFANSALGSKSELIDQMVLGENMITLADGAFYADYGVPDMGILFGPFLFETWDDAWALVKSDWYAEQSELLADKGLTLLASNWAYGDRNLMTQEPVSSPADLKGMKIRVPNNKIQMEGFSAMGATPVGMDLADVYSALQSGTINGVENPLSTLYGRSFQEVVQNITLTAHVRNFTTWVTGSAFYESLTPEQQEMLKSTAEEAGIYNNELQSAAEADYQQKLSDAGVTFIELTDAQRAEFVATSKSFYDQGSTFGWSADLYSTVRKAMGR